jgi:hypothetical protein
MATEKQIEKARKSYNYACNQASKCRHEKYQLSCMACDERGECEINKRCDELLAIISQARESVSYTPPWHKPNE